MSTEMVLPPAALAVSMEQARMTLRLDDEGQDILLRVHISGITSEAEHTTGRAFVNRGMRVTLDSFPDAIRLSAPTFSVESVRFVDVDGEWQTLDPADYYVDKITKPGYIVPARGKSWPATAGDLNSVQVDYTAGYGVDDSAVPDAVKNYILAKLGVQFELQTGSGSSVTKPYNVEYLDRLLDSFMVYA